MAKPETASKLDGLLGRLAPRPRTFSPMPMSLGRAAGLYVAGEILIGHAS